MIGAWPPGRRARSRPSPPRRPSRRGRARESPPRCARTRAAVRRAPAAGRRCGRRAPPAPAARSAPAPARARARRWAAAAWRAGRATRAAPAGAPARAPRPRRARPPACRSGAARPRCRPACASSAAKSGHICAERRPSSSTPPPGLPELDLGDRGEHPGGDAGGALRADRAALEHGHRQPALPCAPGDREADDAAADDGHVKRSSVAGHGFDASPAVAGAHARLDRMPTPNIGAERRARLAAARLYLVCDSKPGGRELSERPARGDRGRRGHRAAAREAPLRRGAHGSGAHRSRGLRAAGALLIVNDRPAVALAAGADGVHVGQEDMPVAQVRELVGADLLIGLSTHAPAEIDRRQPHGERSLRLHRRGSGLRDTHQARSPGGRPGAGPLRRRARAVAVLRDRRHRPATDSGPRPRRGAWRSCARSRARTDQPTRARTPRVGCSALCRRAARQLTRMATACRRSLAHLAQERDEQARAALQPACRGRAARRRCWSRWRSRRCSRSAIAVGALTIHDLRSHGGSVARRHLHRGRARRARGGHVSAALLGGARLRGAAGLPDPRDLAGAGRRLDDPRGRCCACSASGSAAGCSGSSCA